MVKRTEISKYEKEVLELVAEGYTWQEIAGKLFLSHHTVRAHMTNLKKVLGAKTSPHAVTVAFRRGILK